MTKELSIKSIKKELIDKLINNIEILRYLDAEKLCKEGMKLENFYNQIIFDYDRDVNCDYISVEVSEVDLTTASKIGDKKYIVTIKTCLKHEKYLCEMTDIVSGIVEELYPERKRFSNTPYRVINNSISADTWGSTLMYTTLRNDRDDLLHRMIKFEIE